MQKRPRDRAVSNLDFFICLFNNYDFGMQQRPRDRAVSDPDFCCFFFFFLFFFFWGGGGGGLGSFIYLIIRIKECRSVHVTERLAILTFFIYILNN